MHWLFHYFKNIFLLCGKFFFSFSQLLLQACFQNSRVFLRVRTALYSLSACRHVLAEVTGSLLTARSHRTLPRLPPNFSRTSGVPVSSLLVKWASLSPSSAGTLSAFKYWHHFSRAVSQASFSSRSAAVLRADLSTPAVLPHSSLSGIFRFITSLDLLTGDPKPRFW